MKVQMINDSICTQSLTPPGLKTSVQTRAYNVKNKDPGILFLNYECLKYIDEKLYILGQLLICYYMYQYIKR